MAIYILHPGPLTLVSGSGEVVGAPPQWDDGSDATYGRVDNTNTLGSAPGRIQATLEPLPTTVTNITSATLHARVILTNEGSAVGSSFALTMPDTPDHYAWVTPGYSGAGTGVNQLTGTGATYDYVTSDIETAFGDAATLPDLAPYLQAGLTIELFRGGTGAGDYAYHATVYELWVEVEVVTGGPAPWLRQYPRSPLRHWPAERAYQRSNRRAGGYL